MLGVDEKSQIQALDRTQPVLPMLPGIPERRTHDDKCSGAISLFAELLQEAWRLVDEECFLNWQAAFPGVWVLHSALSGTHMPSYLPCLSPRGRTL